MFSFVEIYRFVVNSLTISQTFISISFFVKKLLQKNLSGEGGGVTRSLGRARVKKKPDVKTRLLCEFRPECLKNVQYHEVLNLSWQWTLGYRMGYAIPKIKVSHNLSCLETRFRLLTAALTLLSDSISHITFLFSEWDFLGKILLFEVTWSQKILL